jgi:beta-lactamase superfamily II metal-dependent hydrolase
MEKAITTALRGAFAGILCWVALLSPAAAATSATLAIYFIDVEGGQSTLLVTPEGHALLIDTGWASDGVGFHPGDPRKARDANRIAAAARDAGVSQIDYLLITHFHTGHDGGVSELARLMPVRGFIDAISTIRGSSSPIWTTLPRIGSNSSRTRTGRSLCSTAAPGSGSSTRRANPGRRACPIGADS